MASKTQEVSHSVCRDCRFGTPDMKENNLSITGQPTLIICSLRPWPKHVISERACENFQPR